MKVKGMYISALVIMALLVGVVFMSSTGASSKEITKSEKALDYISQKYSIPKEQLIIVNEGYANYPLSNQKIWKTKIVDRKSTETYGVSFDELGNIVDPNVVKANESAEYAKKYGKLEIELYEKLQKIQPDEWIKVAIWLTPIDINMPIKPDNSEVDETTHEEFLVSYNQAIAIKNKPVIDALEAKGFKLIYASQYAPLIFAELPNKAILEVEKRADVDTIYLSRNYELELNTIASTEKAEAAWNIGITGNGIKIAVIEPDGVEFANPHLADGTYYDSVNKNTYWHATGVAGIIESTHITYKGIAYGAPAILSGNAHSDSDADIIAATEWALNNGADIVSNSWGKDTNLVLSAMDRYMDHLVWTHYKTVIKSAGNNAGGWGTGTGNVTSPGLAYNIITVGAFDDKENSQWSDDEMSKYSSYKDPISPHNDREKPEVVAVGSGFSNYAWQSQIMGNKTYTTSDTSAGTISWIQEVSGTSFSAPSVSAEAALLMQAQNWLKSWPETVKAVIMASAAHNIEGNSMLSEYDGAGGIDISEAMQTASNGWMKGETVYSSSFPKDYTFTVSAGQKVRVAIVWDSHPDSNHPPTTDPLQSDLDLYILDPNGNTVAFSTSYDNSYEIVEFTPTVTGVYTARVQQYRFEGSYEYLGFAYSIV